MLCKCSEDVHATRGGRRTRGSVRLVLVCLLAAGNSSRAGNSHVTFFLDGPCDQVLEGAPGSVYDDSTGGLPDFKEGRPGYTWNVVLDRVRDTSTGNKLDGWIWALGAEGAVSITDITMEGTEFGWMDSCRSLLCYFVELTGPPWGEGPQIDDNRGAWSALHLGMERGLTTSGRWVVARIRVSAEFPQVEGEVTAGRLFFTTRVGSEGSQGEFGPEAFPLLFEGTDPITLERGSPPLEVKCPAPPAHAGGAEGSASGEVPRSSRISK